MLMLNSIGRLLLIHGNCDNCDDDDHDSDDDYEDDDNDDDEKDKAMACMQTVTMETWLDDENVVNNDNEHDNEDGNVL